MDFFTTTGDMLQLGFVQQALLAAAVLGLASGVLAPLVVARQMAFAVHGTAELAFTGAAAALLLGLSTGGGALIGALLAAALLGVLSLRGKERDAVIGVVLAFGLGLGVLFQGLYKGRTSNKFSLLVGQIISTDSTDLVLLCGSAIIVLIIIAVIYRPLLFASVDPDVAMARGVPVRAFGPLFAVLVGVATSLGVQLVGALLVLSLMVTPGAAAARVTANPVTATVLAVLFAETAVLGGIVLSLAPGLQISAFVTIISFSIYVICRLIGNRRVERLPKLQPVLV
ncbi:metal ABC transporter permease [Pseudonocardiaceae bacterium YIM PH 21723]|nr:metal ABC transporter permease [Pseudonocardiaceae bacterium YIM PH 21723]